MKHRTMALYLFLSLAAGLALAQERPEGVEPDGRMVVFYSMPSDADAIESIVMNVEAVTCEEGMTTVDLGEAGSFSIGPSTRSTDPSFEIFIDFERFDIFGGYRDIARADQVEMEWAEDGSFSGRYGFTLFGDDAGNYGLEFDIACE